MKKDLKQTQKEMKEIMLSGKVFTIIFKNFNGALAYSKIFKNGFIVKNCGEIYTIDYRSTIQNKSRQFRKNVSKFDLFNIKHIKL